MIRYVYAVFLGLLTAMFIGIGIATFYPGPTSPQYPEVLTRGKTADECATMAAPEEVAYNAAVKKYEATMSVYNRNVSLLALAGAVIVLVLALTASTKLKIIADGLLLGGVATLGYSIIRGVSSEDVTYRFVITSCGLIAALVLGYLKFIRPIKN